MALKDMTVGSPLDGYKVGDVELVKMEDGSVVRFEVTVVGKQFNEGGVTAKLAELSKEVAAWNSIKDKFAEVVEK